MTLSLGKATRVDLSIWLVNGVQRNSKNLYSIALLVFAYVVRMRLDTRGWFSVYDICLSLSFYFLHQIMLIDSTIDPVVTTAI